MKSASSLCVLAMAAALSSPANALYKCATKDVVVYQDRPCVTGTQAVLKVVVPTSGDSPWKPVKYASPTVEAAAKDASLVAIRVPVVVTPPPND